VALHRNSAERDPVVLFNRPPVLFSRARSLDSA